MRGVISRISGEWADGGLVEVRRGQVQVMDRAALAAGRPN
ncbi:hypothetical protein [Methylorubrum extorquens]|nr:hypothetical protein [Methylorubrum extorquens]MCP1546363.1 hypothetical protein [Methylorubrum extorquens]MCP1591030.1 hypothetical protein [Methylorubrum extorquens]